MPTHDLSQGDKAGASYLAQMTASEFTDLNFAPEMKLYMRRLIRSIESMPIKF